MSDDKNEWQQQMVDTKKKDMKWTTTTRKHCLATVRLSLWQVDLFVLNSQSTIV